MMRKPQFNKKHQDGLSLIEIMVAVTISLILLAGIIQIFTSNKLTYRIQEGMSRLQENGRFALEFLSRDVRMAGFAGCAANVPVTNTTKCPDGSTRPSNGLCTGQDDIVNNFNVGIEGYNDVGATPPTYLSAAGITPVAGTDVMIFRRNSDNPIRIIQNNNGAQVFVEVTTTETDACPGSPATDRISGICEGDILMVSDCSKARIFQAGNLTTTGSGPGISLNITHPASGTPGNSPSSWGGSSAPDEERFGTDAEISKIETYAFYIDTGSNGQPALFRKVGAGAGQELVEGVQNMQVLYGEDTTDDSITAATVYRTANAVADWTQVVSARINLLLATIDDNLAEQSQSITYNGGTFTAADRRIYKVFTATVSIRNRLR